MKAVNKRFLISLGTAACLAAFAVGISAKFVIQNERILISLVSLWASCLAAFAAAVAAQGNTENKRLLISLGATAWLATFAVAIGAEKILQQLLQPLPPPALPAPPAPGIQNVVRIPPGPPCVSFVGDVLKSWAISHAFVSRLAYESEVALDVEMLPRTSTPMAPLSTNDLSQFEMDCMLFYDRYRNDIEMRDRLRRYLRDIALMPSHVDERRMIELGFTVEDAAHLQVHLQQFMMERSALQGDLEYPGIRYLRVTYSVRPRSEVTINAGTTSGYTLTHEQQKLIADVTDTAVSAARCGVRN